MYKIYLPLSDNMMPKKGKNGTSFTHKCKRMAESETNLAYSANPLSIFSSFKNILRQS